MLEHPIFDWVQIAFMHLEGRSTPGGIDEISVVFVELHDHFVEGCSDAFAKFLIGRWITNLGV